MKVLKLINVKYSSKKKNLSYGFFQGNLYSIYIEYSDTESVSDSIFQIFSYLKLPQRGDLFWKDVNTRQLNPTTYRSKMITIITEKNILLKNMKVLDYLKYVTNNFETTYNGDSEYVDYLEGVYSLLSEFGFDKKLMKTKLKRLDSVKKWQLKLVESVLKGSNVLLINKTLDIYDNESLDIYIKSLQHLVEKYNQCVITITEKENISNRMDQAIYI